MIKFLSKKRFNDYLDNKFEDKHCHWFITYDNGKYIACDNTTHNKWVEEFDHLEEAIKWLKLEEEVI